MKFFHKHGFVLLDHRSSLRAEDWLKSEYKSLEAHASITKIAKPYFTDTGEETVQ